MHSQSSPSPSGSNSGGVAGKTVPHFDAFFAHPFLISGAALVGSIGLSIGFVQLLKRSAGALVKVRELLYRIAA
jgi:hypothetical protein